MGILTACPPADGPIFACAQAGCPHCMEALLRQNKGLIHRCIQQYGGQELPYADLEQEGWIALWQAIVHYDPQHGVAFSSYAWAAIRYQLWASLRKARPAPCLPTRLPQPSASSLAEEHWLEEQLSQAVAECVHTLPPRLHQVIVRAYGLEGGEPASLAAIGRQMGLTRARVHQLRNEALAWLRLPGRSQRLRDLCDQDTRAAYQQAQALNRRFLRRRSRR